MSLRPSPKPRRQDTLILPFASILPKTMTVAMKRKYVRVCSPVEARKRRNNIILPTGSEGFLGSVEALRSRLNTITDTQSADFVSVKNDLLSMEREMLIARDKLMAPRIKAVCADVLLFALGVNPQKSPQKSYFTAKRIERRIASKVEALLDCPCFAGRKRSELAAEFDLVINSGLSSFHLQNKADLTNEVNICLRMLASKPDLQTALSLQYNILKEYVHFSPLL